MGNLAPVATLTRDCLGSVARRFSREDRAAGVLDRSQGDRLAIVTGFGPTNAPTAGSLSVMLGVVELQRQLDVPITIVVSELGAWNSRNVPWDHLKVVRDQMMRFVQRIGFDTTTGRIRSHLDHANLIRAGRIARFLSREDFQANKESFVELYSEQGLLGGEVGVTVDGLYTLADILGPAEEGFNRILMISGEEEAYFTDLSRIVLSRQSQAGPLSLGWKAKLGALYFRVLPGLAGYPKMSKSILDSSIHLGMPESDLAARILDDREVSQGALLAAIQLSSGWDGSRLDEVACAFQRRRHDPASWRMHRECYLGEFLRFSALWRSCGQDHI